MINLIKRFIAPPIGRYIINAISSTLKMKVIGYQNYQYIKEMGKKCVIVFWHGQQFYPIYHFRDRKIAIMVSLSNDGEIQNKILSSFGYQVVRGSSSRGAVSGLIGLIKKMREGSDIAIALDGPRGPYQTAKEGVNYIAIKEDCFVLPIACAFKSYKQFGAWDRYILPYPYSNGVMLIGRPIMPNKLNIAAMTHKHLEKILISMSEDAKKILAGQIKPAAQTPENLESKKAVSKVIPAVTEAVAVAETETVAVAETVAETEAETEAVAEDGKDCQNNGPETAGEGKYCESLSQCGEERVYAFKNDGTIDEYYNAAGENKDADDGNSVNDDNDSDKGEIEDKGRDGNNGSGRQNLKNSDINEGANNCKTDKIRPHKKNKPELID